MQEPVVFIGERLSVDNASDDRVRFQKFAAERRTDRKARRAGVNQGLE